MPLIPRLSQTGPLAAAPNMPLDRERRPTVNNGALIQAAGNLGRASQMPLDGTDVSQPWRALGAVGESVMRAGSVVGAVAAKRQEATDRRLVNQAQAAMDQAAIEFRTWQEANPNAPEKWTEEARKRSEDLVKPFLGMKELSQAAKDDLQLMGQSWQTRFIGGVEASSNKAIFGLAKTSYVGRAQRAYSDGKTEDGNASLAEAHKLGYLHDVELEALESEGVRVAKAKRRNDVDMQVDTLTKLGRSKEGKALIEANSDLYEKDELENKLVSTQINSVQSQTYNDLMVIANDDPASAASLAIEKEKNGDISATMRVDVVRKSESIMASNRRQATDEYSEKINTSGMMPTEAEIAMDSRLNDRDREWLLKRMKGAAFDQPTEFEKALSKVMSFKPSDYENEQDAITAATNLQASISATFSGDYAARLKEELGKRQQMTAPGASSATDLGPAMATLDQAIEEGGLGPIRKPVMKDGKPVMRDPKEQGFTKEQRGFFGFDYFMPDKKTTVKENDGQPVPLEEPDPVADAKTQAIKKEIRETVEAEIKAGKLTDQSAIISRSLDLFKLKGGKLKPRPVAGPSPVQMDTLPDGTSPTPASGPNPLLPDIDATLDQYGY